MAKPWVVLVSSERTLRARARQFNHETDAIEWAVAQVVDINGEPGTSFYERAEVYLRHSTRGHLELRQTFHAAPETFT